MQERAEGLEGVVVADTRLSHIDGERGCLVICGHDVEVLAEGHSFEEVCGLLWTGELPGPRERAALQRELGRGREAAFELLPRLGAALDARDPMDALRAATAHLLLDGAAASEVRTRLTGALAVFAAAWRRRRDRLPLQAPDAGLPHVADYLAMLEGQAPDPERRRALERYFVTVVDHGMNASTFTARVIASTLSDPVSAVVGALGALKGPAHGGAPGPVLEMLEAIGTPERARAWLEAELAAGRRIMGMGHRVYRTRDPRAAVLERAIERLEACGIATQRLALARAVERIALDVLRARKPERPLEANVEFYTAVLLSAVGLPSALFTPTFAASRVAGWLAHVEEQVHSGRLIRPSSRYVGPPASARAPDLAAAI